MTLLLDENLPRCAIPSLQEAFPGSTQIALLGMENADDRTIWNYAKDNDFVVVTKDSNFFEMVSAYGQPPQIVWLKVGNQSKAATINALLANKQDIDWR